MMYLKSTSFNTELALIRGRGVYAGDYYVIL